MFEEPWLMPKRLVMRKNLWSGAYADLWLRMPHKTVSIGKRYETLETIHQTTRGAVLRVVRSDNGFDRILKLYRSHQQHGRVERNCLHTLRHPGIVTLCDYGWTKQRELFLELEFVRGRTLADWMQDWSQHPTENHFKNARQLYLCVAESVSYLHWTGWMHGDLRGENIIVTDSEQKTKLIDFEFAGQVHENASSIRLHSFENCAPEERNRQAMTHKNEQFALALMGRQLLKCFEKLQSRDAHYGKMLAVFAKATSEEVENRYDDVDQMLRALKQASSCQEDRFNGSG